eukprot:6723637-Lingulodinium_polyedra.AAC.1
MDHQPFDQPEETRVRAREPFVFGELLQLLTWHPPKCLGGRVLHDTAGLAGLMQHHSQRAGEFPAGQMVVPGGADRRAREGLPRRPVQHNRPGQRARGFAQREEVFPRGPRQFLQRPGEQGLVAHVPQRKLEVPGRRATEHCARRSEDAFPAIFSCLPHAVPVALPQNL